MTVDTPVPFRDTEDVNLLIISEYGDMQSDAFKLARGMEVAYFQRVPKDVPYIVPEMSGVTQVDSWRPYIGAADIVLVDDPAFVAKIAKDFNLDDKVVMYRVNNDSYAETARLMYWLNPMTVDALRAAMENVDIEPVHLERPNWLKRLFRGNRA